MQIIYTQLYGLKYSNLKLTRCTLLYSFKYSYLIQVILKQTLLNHKWDPKRYTVNMGSMAMKGFFTVLRDLKLESQYCRILVSYPENLFKRLTLFLETDKLCKEFNSFCVHAYSFVPG